VGESQSGFFDVSHLDRRVVKKVWRSTLLMKRRRRIAPSSLSHQEQGGHHDGINLAHERILGKDMEGKR